MRTVGKEFTDEAQRTSQQWSCDSWGCFVCLKGLFKLTQRILTVTEKNAVAFAKKLCGVLHRYEMHIFRKWSGLGCRFMRKEYSHCILQEGVQCALGLGLI